jgi:hypothetical protein
VFWEPSPAAAQTDDDDDADDPQQHTYFMNESMSALLDVLPIHAQLSPALVRRIYMGFIELETPDDIFVFFDCTHLFGPGSTPLSLSGGYEWTLMSELQSPRFAPDAALARLLAKHPELTRVRNTALVPFETPMALSACAQPYAAPPARDAVTEARARTLGLAPALPVDTRFFGSAYLFVSPGGRGRERRCAVFAGAHSYTLPFPVGALSDDEARVLEHQLEDLDIAVLHFVDGAHDVWAVKAPNHFTPL